jgi:peptide/nickel transport system substrate-binding protein
MVMRRQMIKTISILLVTSFLFSACGGKQKQDNADIKKPDVEKKVVEIITASDPAKVPEAAKNRKDTLIVGGTGAGGNFNPIYSESFYDLNVSSLVFDGMIDNDKVGKPIPLIAKEWKISEDGKTYTFLLNEGVKFSNGDEVTADDVAFTFTAMCDPKYDGPRTNAVEKLLGYKEYKKGDAKEVAGIKVEGKYKISFSFTEVKASAIYDFAFGIMPKKVYGFEKGEIQKIKDLLLQPVGAGPYKLKKYTAGQEASFEKNDTYWRGTPKIAYIVVKVSNNQSTVQEIKAGLIDVDKVTARIENVTILKEAGFVNLQLYPANNYAYIGLNLRDPLFKDKNVRKALMYGFDRKSFVKAYYKEYGQVVNSHISPVSWAYTDELENYDYNVEKANQLLDAAGWAKKEDGFRYKEDIKFEINWLTYSGSTYVDNLIPLLKENWKKIGISLNPVIMEFAALSEKVFDKQEFQMYNMAWALSIDPDPSGIFSKSQNTLGGFNSVGWYPDKSEELISRGLKETNVEKRAEIYREWIKLVNDDLPYLFLTMSKDMYAISSRVKNMELSPYRKWTQDIHKVELAE